MAHDIQYILILSTSVVDFLLLLMRTRTDSYFNKTLTIEFAAFTTQTTNTISHRRL